jgi:tRNA pseudouridine55 synthase
MSGDMEIHVPIFSAIKVDGTKLYKEAHAGRTPIAPKRAMRFYDIKIREIGSDWFEVELKCSKGGYIRSWAYEVGEKLGVGACVETLRRIWSEPFNIENALKIEELNERGHDSVIPLSQTLLDWPSIQVSGMDLRLISNGQISHGVQTRLRPYKAQFQGSKRGIKVVGADSNNLIALLTAAENSQFSIARIFNS